jgi:hypothetical protein
MSSGPRLHHQSSGTVRRPKSDILPAWATKRLADGGAGLPAGPLLCLICAASALTLVIAGTRLTFFFDDWYFLLQRPGLSGDSIFAPYNGHPSAPLVLLYKGLVEVFGLGSQLPFRVAVALTVVSLGIVMYLLVSERAGRLVGLVAAAIVVFLGAAWEALFSFAAISMIAALTTGLGALLALERDTPLRNAIACLLLVSATMLFGLGPAFVVAATIAVVLRRRPEQLWIPAVPTLLFGVWWVAYGSDAPSALSVGNLIGLPKYVLDCVASGLASIGGRTGESALTWGRPLLVVVAVVVAAWLIRGGRPSPRVLVFLGAALSFWVLAGANYIEGRAPIASRYQIMHVTFLILIAAELFRPIRLSPAQGAAVMGVALVALGFNLKALRDGYSFMREHSAYVKADLGALEITRGRSAPAFRLIEPVAHNPYLTGVTARRYFGETGAHGSPPTYSPQQIAAAPPALRQAADHVMAAGYGMRLVQGRRSASRDGCRRLHTRSDGATGEVEMLFGAAITNMGKDPLIVGVRRFAPPTLPVALGFLGAGLTSRISVPRDSVPLPWHLTASGSSAFQVCPL